MIEDSTFPQHYLIGDVLVQMLETPDGGLDVLAFNTNTGEFERNLNYLSYCVKPGADVEKLSAEEFGNRVEQLREELLLKQ